MAAAHTGMHEWALARPALDSTGPLPEVAVRAGRRLPGYLFVKRASDICLSCLLLLCTWPITLAAAVAIKLTSRGPIIFSQLRAGRGGRSFAMYEFRSMCAGTEADVGPPWALNNLDDMPRLSIRCDPRLTIIGAFLRRTGIGKLPQLFNVLRGDMSLVGPRPLPLPEVFTRTRAGRRRLAVPPGLTCLGQIDGRTDLACREWMQLDLYYIEHRGLRLDLEILIRSIPAVLSRRGAF